MKYTELINFILFTKQATFKTSEYSVIGIPVTKSTIGLHYAIIVNMNNNIKPSVVID
jgi:hypothetical protein